MPDHLRDHPAQSIADGDYPSTIILGGLHVQHIVDATVRHMALQNIKSCQFTRLLNPKAALHQQFDKTPVPERVSF